MIIIEGWMVAHVAVDTDQSVGKVQMLLWFNDVYKKALKKAE